MRWRRTLTLLLAASVAVTACTGQDASDDARTAGELPAEVEGEVLDRRSDAPTAAPDEDGAAPDEAGAAPDEDGAAPDGEGDATIPDGAGTGTAASPEGSVPAPPSAAPRAPRPPNPTATPEPAPAPQRTPDPAPERDPAPDPDAGPEPAPTYEPARLGTPDPGPRTLAAGPATSTGPVLDSDGATWSETSSSSVDAGASPPPLTVALLAGPDAPERAIRCRAALEAPADRGLVARGTLRVALRLVATDGEVTTVRQQRRELDVTLAPGRFHELPASPPRTVDVAEVRQVTCVAELAR